ncbi:hypothetical protein BH23GEM2_BH23GEM2_22730 [soil metagenome]
MGCPTLSLVQGFGLGEIIGSPTAGRRCKSNQVNGEPTVRLFQWRGFHVAAWDEPGLTHALVGDLPQERLSVLARECITQMVAIVPADSGVPAGRG